MLPGYSLTSRLEYRAIGLVSITVLVIIIGVLFILELIDKNNFFWATLTMFFILYLLFLRRYTNKTFLKKMKEEGKF